MGRPGKGQDLQSSHLVLREGQEDAPGPHHLLKVTKMETPPLISFPQSNWMLCASLLSGQLKKVFQQGRPMEICDLVMQLQQPRPLVSLNKVGSAHILHIMQLVFPAGGALPTRVAQSRPLVGGRGVSPDTGSRGRGVTPEGRNVARWDED